MKRPSKRLIQEDPPVTIPRYDWTAIAEQLRASPSVWFKVFEKDRISIVTAIRQGNIKALRKTDGFEVKSSNNNKKVVPMTCSLYLRFNPRKVK